MHRIKKKELDQARRSRTKVPIGKRRPAEKKEITVEGEKSTSCRPNSRQGTNLEYEKVLPWGFFRHRKQVPCCFGYLDKKNFLFLFSPDQMLRLWSGLRVFCRGERF